MNRTKVEEKSVLERVEEKSKNKKDKKKKKDSFESAEKRIIVGEDAVFNSATKKSRIPNEVFAQFEGKSREVR